VPSKRCDDRRAMPGGRRAPKGRTVG
jgi:hypothetical protein